MKRALLTGLAMGMAIIAQAADPAPANPSPSPEAASTLKNDVDKFSYSIGLGWGTQMRQQSIDVTPELILRGLQDGIGNKTPLMTSNEVQQIQESMRKIIMAKREAMVKDLREKNLVAANKFLEENATKEGVKKTASGLQYKVLKEGSGAKPKPTDRVAVQYRGRLINGTEFDSSARRGPDPAVLSVGAGMVKGWTEALTNMSVGSKWEVYMAPQLAYGEQGKGNIIEPNSPLIFEIELVEIKKPEAPPQPITSDIIKVPSKAELDAGAKIEIIKPEDLAKLTNKPAGAAKGPGAPASATPVSPK